MTVSAVGLPSVGLTNPCDSLSEVPSMTDCICSSSVKSTFVLMTGLQVCYRVIATSLFTLTCMFSTNRSAMICSTHQSFMSLNAPASPKRLSALEMTFPSLDSLGYGSDSDDEYSNVGTSNHMSGSPTEGGRPLEGRLRLSSFHEYGNRPAPTSLAVLSGLISGAAKMIDRAYHEQHVPVPDIDNPGITKSKFAKPAPELNVSPEIYKAIEVCIEACHQLVGIVQRPEVTIAEAAYAFEVSAALKVTTEAHVVEVLREEGPKGMNIARLAERVKMEPNFLLRVMRLLAAHNIFLEMGAGTQWFANNRVSLRLDSGEPLNNVLADPPTESPDGAKIEIRSMISHATDYTWHSASQMEERLRGKEIKYVKAEDENEKRARLYRQMNARKLGSHLGDPPSLLQGEKAFALEHPAEPS